MCDKVNLDEIKRIPPEQFKEILHSWMDQKEITQVLHKKLRKQLVTDFQKTELAKKMEAEKQQSLFNSKNYVIDTLQAEHLYTQNNHFSLSVFFTETRHPTLLPNFEKSDCFRFEKSEIQELAVMLGLAKTDPIVRKILNKYKTTHESLLSILLKELIKSRKTTETRNFTTQTDDGAQHQLDLSIISSKSKSKKSKRRKNHGLVNQEFKARKQKKVKEVTVIASNLEKMSNNIIAITNKLDNFASNPCQDESKAIIGHVGTIMSQLNGCVSNFETICCDIKQINETRNRNYDEWMDDLKNSENGRRFLKKLQKSFSRVISEEKSKIKGDYRKKLEREKSKILKVHRSRSGDKKIEEISHPVAKEINEMFKDACSKIKNIEKKGEQFEKSVELDVQKKRVELSKKRAPIETIALEKKSTSATKNKLGEPEKKIIVITKQKPSEPPEPKVDLNARRKIYSSESSDPSYSSKSFEKDESDENN